jgi:mono/diheme cytochrome c family protein
MRNPRGRLVSVLVVVGLAAIASAASAQGQMRGMDMDKGKGRPEPPATIRTTMEELHASGGVPRGWKFLVPPGDAAEGRKVFAAMECFACHDVKGEGFPQDSKTPKGAGPELTGMGSRHPAEYFAESILNPNRVILQGPGYTGADGLSKMPSYADSMTLQQLVDLVAYLKSLTAGEMRHGDHQTGGSMKMDGPMKMK